MDNAKSSDSVAGKAGNDCSAEYRDESHDEKSI